MSEFGFYEQMIERGRQLHAAGFQGASTKDTVLRQGDDYCLQAFLKQDRDSWVARVEAMFEELPEGFFDVELIG